MSVVGSPVMNVLIGLLAFIMSAIAIIGIITTYTGAGHGKVVTRSRIQLFGVFEIIAGLLRMFGDPITGIVLIVAGIMFLASLQKFSLAKISFLLTLFSLVTLVVVAALTIVMKMIYYGLPFSGRWVFQLILEIIL